MASAQDKQAKKDEAAAARALRDAGKVPHWRGFHLDAGRRTRTAWVWIPRLRMVILASSVVSAIGMVAAVWAVWARPPAMTFLSFPDGTIACSPRVDAQGRPQRLAASQQAVCDRLQPPVGLAAAAAPAESASPPDEATLPAALPAQTAPASPLPASTPASQPASPQPAPPAAPQPTSQPLPAILPSDSPPPVQPSTPVDAAPSPPAPETQP